MGWASGTYVFKDIENEIEKISTLSHEEKIKIYTGVIKALEYADWDTQNEVMGENSVVDEAMKKRHPKWFKGEE